MRLALKDRSKTLSKFASPRHDIDNPIYNWYPFKHSYSKDLVNYLINEFNLKKGSWVLDPFCGGGTTLLACKEKGINAYGVDILPFSVFLSKTKTQEYDLKKINAIFKEFQNNHNLKDPELKLPDIPIVSKAFSKKVANELLSIKSFIYKIKGREKDLFNLGLLSISESVSNTSKSGGFLRIVNRKVNHTQVRRKFINRVKGFISALEKYQTNRNNKTTIKIFKSDARHFCYKKKFDAVITSPPYPNRHDYSRIYSLEMILDGLKSNDELKSIRYKTIRSHVEARKQFESKCYEEVSLLLNILKRINKNGLNNPQVEEMLKGYFEDMYIVLENLCKHLKPKGKLGIVVSNVRFSGISVPVDKILALMGQQLGLKLHSIILLRRRGNSSQQMKKYKRKSSRESIIIWDK